MTFSRRRRPRAARINRGVPLLCCLLPLLSYAGAAAAASGGMSLATLPEIDALRADNADAVVRRGNVDVVLAGDDDGDNGDGGGSTTTKDRATIGICNLPYVFPFRNGRGPRPWKPWNDAGTFEGGAAVALAAQHLNSGDGSVVPEVGGLNERCSIRFTVEMHDSAGPPSEAVEQMIDMTEEEDIGEGQQEDPRRRRRPCAFLGALRSDVSVATSIISGKRGYPQISPFATSPALDEKSLSPLFGRTISSLEGAAVPLVLFMRDVVRAEYLAVVHTDYVYGLWFAAAIQKAASDYAPDMRVVPVSFPEDATDEVIAQAVKFLRDTQYTYFFGILQTNALLEAVMTEGYKQGIAGTGKHNWIFRESYSGSMGRGIVSKTYERGSALERSFRGALLLSATAGVPGMPAYDKLAEGLRDLKKSERDLEYIKSILPSYDGEAEDGDDPRVLDPIVEGDDFLASPGFVAPFLYDAVVALGLAACNASDPDTHALDGTAHFEAFKRTSFNGTSGDVVFDHGTGTREPLTAHYHLVNVVDDDDDNDKGDDESAASTSSSSAGDPTAAGAPPAVLQVQVQFKRVEVGIFRGGAWHGREEEPYTYNDGSRDGPPPSGLPDPDPNENHLTPAMRSVGLVLFSIVIVLSAAFGLWTRVNRTTRVVKGSQPIFLGILCAGTAVMVSSIVPLSIDRGVASERGCDIACASFPWPLSVGFSVIMSALFTKTRRLNRIFKSAKAFKRIKVTAMDVAKPMIVILGTNIVVLSVWTALSPLQYGTIIVSSDPFGRPTETYGVCSSERTIPYVVTLAVVNLGALSFAVYEAFVARSLSTEFSESKYIFRAMVLILLVCFMGIPIVVIAKENPNAAFFAFSGIIFVVCCSILLLMFVPKILYQRRKKEEQTPSRTTEASTVTSASSSSGQDQGSSLMTSGLIIFKRIKTPKESEGEANRLEGEVEKLTKENSRLKSDLITQASQRELDGFKDNDTR